MLSTLISTLRGATCALAVSLNTLVFVPLLLLATLFKLVMPLAVLRRTMTQFLVWIAESWVAVNSLAIVALQPTVWDISGTEGLDPKGCYLVTCNHQSWADIPVLQRVFRGRIPFLKFFLKSQLIWVPLLGAAWWALDFPFMKRYSRKQLEKNPALRGKDLETTRQACEKFKHQPVTILNFLEGTRFTRAKAKAQGSPYQHLLKPRAGGIGFVLGALGDKVSTLLDVTIVYTVEPTFWDFMCGRIPKLYVQVTPREIPVTLRGRSYLEDESFRLGVQEWVRDQWAEKDAQIERLKA